MFIISSIVFFFEVKVTDYVASGYIGLFLNSYHLIVEVLIRVTKFWYVVRIMIIW